MNCVVEMWGLSRELSGVPEVEISLAENAGLRDVVRALRDKLPALEGNVIVKGEDKLDDSCTFNVNGNFYQEADGVRLHEGDRIRLLTLATGG